VFIIHVFFADISGQVTVSSNASGAASGSSSPDPGSTPSANPSSGSENSSASSVTVSRGTWWALLSAAMLLSGLVL